jgi:ribosome maturation factor RimP
MSSQAIQITPHKTDPQDHLIELISKWVNPLGFRVIYLEFQSHRQKVLRIYIDHLQPTHVPIGIEDCVKVARALDAPLDEDPEMGAAFQGGYELEVSSPGVYRPLRTAEDFERFKGQEVRIHSFRPLTGEELENVDYQQKNSRQKNFLGTLMGIENDKVVLLLPETAKEHQKTGKKRSQSQKKKSEVETNSEEGTKIAIPLPLISKANLEPRFELEESDERE